MKLSPRQITQTAFVLSLLTSVTFNVWGTALATNIVAACAINSVWSAFAFLAVEIMVKVKFPARKRNAKRNPWNWVRFGGVGLVALISMVISYVHTFHVMMSWDSGLLVSLAAPLAIDGLLTLSGLTLLVIPA